jgi:uncharacterized protein with gpF-like domain
MEAKLTQIYQQAETELMEKWQTYMSEVSTDLAELQQRAEAPGATPEEVQAYKDALQDRIMNDSYYRDMVNEYTSRLAQVNKIALAYVNDQLPHIYTVSYNALADQIASSGIKVSFHMVDEHTVKRLITDDKVHLYKKRMDIPKDKRWNRKLVNSQITQGILQGESIPKIAARLQNVTDMNEAAAIRNARTMTTCAESIGRQDSYNRAEEIGIVLEQEWLATHDGRTRAWHMELDGQRREVGKPFENSVGKIRFPGDPQAKGANIYNCRCALCSNILGFRNSDGTIERV